MNINQLKHEVHDTYEKDEKITTSFEPSNGEDVINKAFFRRKFIRNKRLLIIIRKNLQ